MTGPVTIKTVAEAANCAVSTVSRALRDDPAISDESKQRIRQVAESLNYRRLRRRRSRTEKDAEKANLIRNKRLVVITLGMDRSLTSLPVIGETLNGLEDTLSSLGLRLQVTHVPDLREVPSHLDCSRLDGVFLFGALQGRMLAESGSSLLQHLRKLPTVWLLGRPDGCWGDCVGSNDVLVGTMAADYLANHGHRHVAFVNPKPDHVLMMNRETGFLAQAQRRGVHVQRCVESPDDGWTLPLKPPLTIESVQHLVDCILESKPRPTALFASSDSVAAVVYGALAVRGMRVGDEISVVSGNNDWPLIAGLHPSLTTYDIHARDIGRLAVQQMASRLRVKETLPDVELATEPHLISRESVQTLTT